MMPVVSRRPAPTKPMIETVFHVLADETYESQRAGREVESKGGQVSLL
jgi:hypothetical protein